MHTNIEPGLAKRGLNGIMRGTIAACAILVLLLGTADAEQCPPGALGVSRTLVVDPNEHPRVGSMQYPETLPLNDHEVVLTFDDGPVPRYTTPVLETLASECVKATFFMVGQMARAYPWMVRRVYDEGHTIANHTQNHPIRKMSVTQAAREIEEGFASLRETTELLGGQHHVDSLLLQKDHDELRWLRRTRIATDRVHIVGPFIESLPWHEGDLLAAPHLHDNRTLQDVDECVCVVTMDGVHRPRRIIDGDHQHLLPGYIG
jgi:peptidoglycan/xylan/chitin deacetylase (PgdA/CDA1 family)